jgi:hypothetical protein
MKKAIVVLLIFLMLALSACASQTPALQEPTATPQSPSDTPTPPIRRRRTPTPVEPSPSPSPATLRATDTPTAGPAVPNSSSTYTITAAYAQDGGSEIVDGETYIAANADQSAVYVNNSGKLTLTNAAITTSGNTSSQDNSSFHGLNAAVLAAGGSSINLSDSTIATSGAGANGAFATDARSSVTLSNVTIQASADGAHGVMATNGGSLILTNVDITTAGGSSGAIVTDRGGGTIKVTGGTVITSGQNSPDIYSTGAISVTGGTMRATGAEAAVIEGGNSITLTNTSLFSTMNKWGVMIYQSTSGDEQGSQGSLGAFTMTGGSLAYDPTSGPLFYVTNSTALITLKGAALSSASRILLKASAGNWGNRGSNGGTVIFTADSQALAGDLVADNLSSITLTLQKDSTWTGTINGDHTAKFTHLTMDATTSWYVTGDSYLTCLTDPDEIFETIVANITGNGYTVYYEASACPNLHGRTYPLIAGGSLKPAD